MSNRVPFLSITEFSEKGVNRQVSLFGKVFNNTDAFYKEANTVFNTLVKMGEVQKVHEVKQDLTDGNFMKMSVYLITSGTDASN